ncbi:MFS transporter [Phenylobacterium immobile]|uniref:MFS transporter n=1 Tax=Phenylobacterium immobile TaxID=21 RepID=UPI000AECA873|nr:MFS transporter [Phenylobacterium immobile]
MSASQTIAKRPSDSPFSVPLFRGIWSANLVAQFGGQIQAVAAAWMMTSMHASPQLIALVQTSTTAPIVLFSLLAGALADGMDRRRVMICAQVFMLFTSACLAVFTGLGLLSPWVLLCFTFLIACGNAFNMPAWQASVGDIVPRSILPNAVAMNGMGFNLARSLGPALGGMLLAYFSAAVAFLVNAVSYIPLSIVLARWKPERSPRSGPPERLHYAMGAGLRYVAMSPSIIRVLFRAALFGFAAAAIPALMPVVARDVLSGGPVVFGALSGAFGVGAVTGAFLGAMLRRKFATETILRIAGLCVAIGALVSAVSHIQMFTMAALLAAGVGWVLGLSTCNVTVQMASPRWVVGRAISVYQMGMFGGMALGSWGFGFLAEHQGVSIALLASGGCQLLAVAAGLFAPLPKLEALDLDPLGRWSEPETSVPVEPRSGPVFITVAYHIPPERLEAFHSAMAERRRIRRRDGAQGWHLMRDLARPDTWLEMYHVPTWADYVRHNQRRTNADVENIDHLNSLHAGDGPPVVTRMLERQSVGLLWGLGGSAPMMRGGENEA